MREGVFSKIANAISSDEQNSSMTKKGYDPVFTASSLSKVVIIGQAPGIVAQESQIPWNDQSGKQLRRWLGITDADFYDSKKCALIPMDFYFPGSGKSGDLPPRKGFAEKWHPKVLSHMHLVKLTILVGAYSQKYYLPQRKRTLTETVRSYEEYLDDGFFPIPHPSPRNNIWKKKNPWFEAEVVSDLQKKISSIL